MKKLQNIYVNRSNSILVVVDVENEFCKPQGKLYNETSARIMPGVISAINKLIVQARSARIPIIYIQSQRTHDEAEFKVFNSFPILKKGTWNSEIINEITPQKGDSVISKFTHDPFYRSNFDEILDKLVPDPTNYYSIIVGGAINVCVYSTVMGFHLRDYWTVVPIDCVYYASDVSYQRAIEQFSEGPYPNIFLSQSDMIRITDDYTLLNTKPIPKT